MWAYLTGAVGVSFKLVIETEIGKSIQVDVDKDNFVIGRSQKCDVVIPEEGLSRQHCMVEVVDGVIFVTDLNSANGVFIDDTKIPAHQKTRYFTTSRLVCGTAEIVEFLFKDKTTSLLEIQQTEPVPVRQAKENAGRARSSSLRKRNSDSSSDLDKRMSTLHPGVKGFLFIALISVGYLVFKNVFGHTSSEDEVYQLQYDSAMKNKKNDGSVKTSNF